MKVPEPLFRRISLENVALKRVAEAASFVEPWIDELPEAIGDELRAALDGWARLQETPYTTQWEAES